MLVVEIDGGQHDGSAHDDTRTDLLVSRGYSVLRFWNNEVLGNPEGCYRAVADVLAGTPSPDFRFAPATLSPQERGKTGQAAQKHREIEE